MNYEDMSKAELIELVKSIGAGGVKRKLMPGAESAGPVAWMLETIYQNDKTMGPVKIVGIYDGQIPKGAVPLCIAPVADQVQPVDRSTEMQGKKVDESQNLQSQQQPVSGADGFPKLMDTMFDAAAWYVDAHGICIEPEQLEGILSAALDQQSTDKVEDADKVDAERYRYLRGYRGHKATGVLLKGILFNGHESLARTDEVIDAARKEQA